MNQLSKQTIEIVKSTAPLIEEKGAIITEDFYARLFEENPALLNIFNLANQRKGTQAEALFNAVLAYAKNIENIEVLVPAVTHIAHKHASLNVQPEHYGVVGGCLLTTIQNTFDLPDGHEILQAWAEAYQILADIFIGAEEGIYQQNEQGESGWRDFKPFFIDRIVNESPLVKSFYLKPVDGQAVQVHQGGQYISVRVKPDNNAYEQIRQYSLSDGVDNVQYRISTKREEQGVVTNYMHGLRVGDKVDVHAPTGVFTLNKSAQEHVFISGGVGITALLGMLKELGQDSQSQAVTFIQCVKDKSHELFRDEVLASKHLTSYKLCLSSADEGDAQGRLNANVLEQWQLNKHANVYLCGPLAFMKAVYQELLAIGFNDQQIHYEVFGPNASLSD